MGAQANNLRFRVRCNGTQKLLDPLPSSSTIHTLQSAIIAAFKLINVQPACLEIKYHFPPPTVISRVAPNTSLSSLKLSSGNLIVSILNAPFQSPNALSKSQDSE